MQRKLTQGSASYNVELDSLGSFNMIRLLDPNDSFGAPKKKMRVLIAMEFSGIVREAFKLKGHDAWSCDFLDTEIPGQHIKGDVFDILDQGWDLMICHPPCTFLAVSGARWFKYRKKEQKQALDVVKRLLNAPINKICLENPISIISSKIRKPDQIVHPWMFGDPYQKATCLWLKNLPKLVPTNVVLQREQKCWKEPPSKDRWKNRSRTYPGIAKAMADFWG